MTDTYPGSGSDDRPELSGADKVNAIVYRNMALLLRHHRPIGMPSPNSALGQDAHARLSAMSERGVDLGHLATVSGIADIHYRKEIEVAQAAVEDAAQASLAEMAAIMEEPPGA